MNILFGGNGVGKSSLLEAIKKDTLIIESDKEFEIMYYSKHNLKVNKNKELKTTSEFVKALNSGIYSEGKASIHHIISFLEDVKDRLKSNDNIVVLMDEIDSGLSAENINMLMWEIKELVDTDKVQIFIATNHYHWVYVYKNIINMYKGKYERIESYEEYFDKLNKGIPIMHEKGRDFSFLDVYFNINRRIMCVKEND